ncbi:MULTISPECIES: hypothetical protein [unclassified Chroococcidiopsis]|nr:hypothetical protein [Chroococcidiopsis sp. SAG 2025]
MPPKLKFGLIGLLAIGTAATFATSYSYLGMAGIAVFLLAYLSKGMRKHG